ncbi:threonylcarbamoyl-AMP synthase [Alphaproteobacteria bacterium]|nr:threonylcarbamoyl-AMP synthase [Alphaproteobacteria bacterium]GHS98490.1 threonylcarbamoyl-AMP synthase [Alphaproteobacteria bacterium]
MFDSQIQQAIASLNREGVVAIPTETVYGLAADASSDKAVAAIYAIKNRPVFNPLILHVEHGEQAFLFGDFSPEAQRLAKLFWQPGTPAHRPLTLIVPIRRGISLSKLATVGLETVGIRVPDHPLTQALLHRHGRPLFAPSANMSTKISATDASIVQETLGDKISCLLDGGPCRIGLESTILDTTIAPFSLLRYGGTTLEELTSVCGYAPKLSSPGSVMKAPGMLKKHYVPSLKLKMNQTEPKEGEAFLGFGQISFGPYNLSVSKDLREAAGNLFRFLYALDDPQRFSGIRVAPIPQEGLGWAINDRLERASCSE